MLYRVRGPFHSDTTHIATELRGLIAHTGPIRLGYLQIHGVAAQTIQVRDDAAAFFEETMLPKIGAAGSFIEHRAALRQPKELKVAATLCPTTATALPDLSTWGGVWSEVVYTPRSAIVRVRCLVEDADRITELGSQGWRVLRGPAALFSWLAKSAPFAPQFWPVQASGAAANASDPAPALSLASVPAPVSLAAAAPSGSTLTAAEVLAAAGVPNLLVGVTPTGEGVRLAWRSMIVSVQDGGERQDSVVASILFRAMSQGMGALVIAERAKVTPRLLAPLANRLRIIDMADPWESARIPWRNLPPEVLKLLLGGSLPSPLPETLADALRAAGRRGAATPVLEALTREPAYDLAGTLEAGGGVVLLLEPGASASLLASLLVLGLSIAPLTRPLLICRPAALPMPPSLASRAVQFVFGDAPTAALQLRATPGAWTVLVPDGTQIVLQENLSASVVEQAGADHAALVGGLQGLGWASGSLTLQEASEQPDVAAIAGLGWPEAEAEGIPPLAGTAEGSDAAAIADLGWPEGVEAEAEDVSPLAGAAEGSDAAAIADLGWPEGVEAEAEDVSPLAGAAEGSEEAAIAGLGWPEGMEADAEEVLTFQEASEQPDEHSEPPSWLLTLQEASEQPEEALEPLIVADGGLTLQEASEQAEEAAIAGLGWPEGMEAEAEDVSPLAGAAEGFETALGWPEEPEAEADSVSPLAGAAEPLGDELALWASADSSDVPGFDLDEWPSLLLDDDLPNTSVGHVSLRRRFKVSRRRGLVFHAYRHIHDSVPPLAGAVEGSDAAAIADLGWREEPEADTDSVSPLAGAAEGSETAAIAGLGWPEEPEEDADSVSPLVGATEGFETPLGWSEEPEAEADSVSPLAGAAEGSTVNLEDLVHAWHRGESMSDVARELRQRIPSLSLLDAMHALKAAIHAQPLPHSLAVLVSPDPVTAVVELLRGQAAQAPVEPAERDTLLRWRSGIGRRAVVREIVVTYGFREADVRGMYNRVILPHVISDLNGSAESVVRFLRNPESEQADLPPVVMTCIARLVGTPANTGVVRSLLPSLRETLAALDTTGRS